MKDEGYRLKCESLRRIWKENLRESSHLEMGSEPATKEPGLHSSFRLHPSSLFNNSALRSLDELNKVLHFFRMRKFFLDSCERLRSV